jgi:hypothetical protein
VLIYYEGKKIAEWLVIGGLYWFGLSKIKTLVADKPGKEAGRPTLALSATLGYIQISDSPL